MPARSIGSCHCLDKKWFPFKWGQYRREELPAAIVSSIQSHSAWQRRKTISRLLADHFVMADPKKRKDSIQSQLDELEKELKVKIIERERVIPQVMNLTEWPLLTSATFNTEFLRAPKEVLISEMVEHQKYFPVANAGRGLKKSLHHYSQCSSDR